MTNKISSATNDHLRVLSKHAVDLQDIDNAQKAGTRSANAAIASSETLLAELDAKLPSVQVTPSRARSDLQLRSWSEVVSDTPMLESEDKAFQSILTAEEIEKVVRRHSAWEREFSDLCRLDSYDYAVAGTAGLLAAMIDIFLVQVPRHSGFLGCKSHAGGWLSNLVKERFGNFLPPDTIRALERSYSVPFDPSTSRNLARCVEGLGPATHRFYSLGHDPLIGWVVGVRDVLAGEFTALNRNGRLVIQAVPGMNPAFDGQGLFTRLAGAFHLVGGHLASDVATPAGLPAPLMPLLMFLQFGRIGHNEYTVGELARQMYRAGYDFRHFLAGSIPVLLIETIVRVAYFVKELNRGSELAEAFPVASRPRLRMQLLLAHGIAAAVNAGKIAILQNPLALSWGQWLVFFRYLLPQIHWILVERDESLRKFMQKHIDDEWDDLHYHLEETWAAALNSQ